MWDNDLMEKQKLAEFALAAVVLIFGVLIAINYAYVDEGNGATITSALFARRQADAPLLRVVDVIKEGTYSKSIVAYPQLVRGPIDFNNSIKNFVDDLLQHHEATAKSNWEARLARLGPAEQMASLPGVNEKLPMTVSWEPAEISDAYISFLIRVHEVTGDVHDVLLVKTFNYDVRQHKLIALSDIFPNNPNYLAQLSGFSYDSLKQQLTTKFSGKLSDAALKWLKAGTAPEAKQFAEFTINHKELTLYFSQYQVAAYDQGIPEVVYTLE